MHISFSHFRYAHDICQSSASDNITMNCATALSNHLRRMENRMLREDDSEIYRQIMNPASLYRKMNKSSNLVIKITTDLFGILSSMGQLRQSGILWADEFCLFRGIKKFRFCTGAVLTGLSSATKEASRLELKRKSRIKQCRKRIRNAARKRRKQSTPHLISAWDFSNCWSSGSDGQDIRDVYP